MSWTVSYATMLLEVWVAFIIFSKRAGLRKTVTLGLEGMHLGMVFMGPVVFGVIMTGADSVLRRDSDHRSLVKMARAVRGGPFTGGPRSGGRRYPTTLFPAVLPRLRHRSSGSDRDRPETASVDGGPPADGVGIRT